MSRDRKERKDEKPKVPAYIVTFSDMVTLLLTFFVLLLSLAQTKDSAVFIEVKEAFVNNIRNFGIGRLYGQRESPDFGNVKSKHYIEDPNEEYKGRTISAKEDKLRRTFKALEKSMTPMASQMVSEKTDYTITNIHFKNGSWELDENARNFLGNFCNDLVNSKENGSSSVYVLGLAGDQKNEKQMWMTSARRAQSAGEFLKEKLSSDGQKVSVFWWGAGPGGEWAGEDSLISKDTQVLIGVLRKGK